MRDFSVPGEKPAQTDDLDSELAYLVQKGQPGDPRLAEILFEHYQVDLTRLGFILLAGAGGKLPDVAEVGNFVQYVLIVAVQQIDRFWGETSVRNWLFSISLKLAPAWKRRRRIQSFFRRLRAENAAPIKSITTDETAKDAIKTAVEQLPAEQRLIMALRYGLRLRLSDLADVLKVTQESAHERLVVSRQNLGEASGMEFTEAHAGQAQIMRLIQRQHDGLLAGGEAELDELEKHLGECSTCRAVASSLDELERRLVLLYQESWVSANIDLENQRVGAQPIFSALPGSHRQHLLGKSIRQSAWGAGLLLIFLVVVLTIIQITPEQPEFISRPTATATPLPTPIPFDEEVIALSEQAGANPDAAMGFISLFPQISTTGRWITFVSSIDLLNSGDLGERVGVYLYDRSANTIERLTTSLSNFIYGMFPSVSQDGRWVVVGYEPEEALFSQEDCYDLREQMNCSDIILLDRKSLEQVLITKAYDGTLADGTSFLPEISADGRWVVFWSSAGNLVTDDGELCTGGQEAVNCVDLFLYDRITEQITRIPVGRPLIRGWMGMGKPQISHYGRWISFTIYNNDKLGEQMGIENFQEAVVYDRVTGQIELVNQSSEGIFGDGPSFTPVVSDDGRYVAFASQAGNLVPDDTNNAADVFVRDRQEGTTQRVSISSNGMQGNDYSGIYYKDDPNITWGYEIGLSGDGRYVGFLSYADNLASASEPGCQQSIEGMCNRIYLHDRQTGQTELVAVSQTDSSLWTVDLSEDGRWITYLELSTYGCNNMIELCSEILVYDRQRGWAQPITRDMVEVVNMPWNFSSTLSTPFGVNYQIEIAPDGNSFAVASMDGKVSLLSVSNGELIRLLEGRSNTPIQSLAFSPAEDFLAGGAADGDLYIWRIADGSRAFEIDGDAGPVRHLVFSNDGQWLLVKTPKVISIWQRTQNKLALTGRLEYPENLVSDIALFPSNDLLAVAGTDGTVWLQRFPDGGLIARLGEHFIGLTDVAIAPDGKWLASRSRDGLINLWEVIRQPTGEVLVEHIKRLSYAGWLGDLAFFPDGKGLISGSVAEGLVMWRLPEGDFGNMIIEEMIDNVYMVSNVKISADGRRMIAPLRRGISVWEGAGNFTEMDYFEVVQSEIIEQVPGFPLAAMGSASPAVSYVKEQQNHLTLYQADEIFADGLLAPTRLPETVNFKEAQVTPDREAILRYEVRSVQEANPLGELYIVQRYFSDLPVIQVGPGANVKKILIGNQPAEIVKGNWSQTLEGMLLPEGTSEISSKWIWDGEFPAYQLRWADGNYNLYMYYQPYAGIGDVFSPTQFAYATPPIITMQPVVRLLSGHVSKADLIEIAESLERISEQAVDEEPIIREISLHTGDTCIGIAQQYNTTVDELIRLNNLPDDCSLILAGRTMRVPLAAEYNFYSMTDLDCNGDPERLQTMPILPSQNSDVVYGVLLEAIDEMGLYREAWRYTVSEAKAAFLTDLQVFSLGGCQQFVAFNVLGGEAPGLKIWRWQDGMMELILEAAGLAQAPFITQDAPNRISVHRLERTSLQGTCQDTLTIYDWDGEQFYQVMQSVNDAVSCGNSSQ